MSPHTKIRKYVKRKHPKAAKKAKKLFKFKYPKLFALIIAIILAYIIFKDPGIATLISGLETLSYLGIFISGILLAFGFSAPFAVGFMIVAQPPSICLAALIGGVGAAFSDYVIFKTIKFSFMNEFENLKKEETVKLIRKIAKQNTPILIRHYVLYLFAGIFIATPLPDEIGISMLAGLTTVKIKILTLIAFILHAIAIYLILIASA